MEPLKLIVTNWCLGNFQYNKQFHITERKYSSIPERNRQKTNTL